MKISRSSWHYIVIDKCPVDLFHPTSLCPYFWMVVLAICIWIGAGVLACCVAAILAGMAFVVVVTLFYPFMDEVNRLLAYLSGVLYLGICIWLWKYDQKYGLIDDDKCGAQILNAPIRLDFLPEVEIKKKKPKEPNILWEFIKAKHEKICPHIDFTYED